MKRADFVQFIKETLNKVPAKKDGTHSDFDCEFLLTEMEKMGMTPPKVTLSTPLGARITLEIRDWEENIDLDEAGYDMKDPNRPDNLRKAKIIR